MRFARIGRLALLFFALFIPACSGADTSPEVASSTLLPVATIPPAETQSASEPVGDKWELWTNGTRLRGADMHPCKMFDAEGCIEPLTKQDLQALRDAGANLVNLSYPGIYSLEAPYQPDPAALDYLDDATSWAEEVGIYVVIHFRTGPGRNEAAIHQARGAIYNVWSDQDAHDAWLDMWRFTAERYKDSPVVVGYDLMVEPLANFQVDPRGRMGPEEAQAEMEGTLMNWNAFAAEMTAAIREVDANTPIIVSSLHWASADWFAALEPTGDPRTVYSLHTYDPDVYTGQEPDDDRISYPSLVDDAGETVVFDRSWLAENLRPALEFSQTYNVPIYVGETGAVRWVPGGVEFHSDQTALYEEYGWNYAFYVWRGDEPGWDGFNLEYGTDPDNHASVPDNPLLSVYLQRWQQNVNFPP